MKKLSYLFLMILIVFTSCEDADKSPAIESDVAPFVRYEAINNAFDVSDPTIALTGVFFAQNPELIASHQVFVGLENGLDSASFVPLTTIEQFPFDFSASLIDVALALGVDVNELPAGGIIRFESETTGIDGTIINTSTISVATENFSISQQQGYTFSAAIVCPVFDVSGLVGTYEVTTNILAGALGLTDPDPIREVILGPGDNQVTIVGGSVGFAGGSDLILNIDTALSAATLGLDLDGNPGVAFPVGTAGLTFGSNYGIFAIPGLVLPCLDTPTISIPVELTCCGGGPWTLNLSRI